jgi:SpoIID/LytB domain protein
VGKELEIRRWLSESHLYSSAFVVEKQPYYNQSKFILHGAGWGHGVGLCQMGAAVMGAKGYRYEEILAHYFRNTEIRNLYNKE